MAHEVRQRAVTGPPTARGDARRKLLLQIDNWMQLEDGGGAEVANFCSDGTAYIFVDRSREAPVYTMIINR